MTSLTKKQLKLLETVRKLENLTQSSNIHEAANAAGKMQMLVERYNLGEALRQEAEATAKATPTTETEEPIQDRVVFRRRGRQMPTWLLTLTWGVTKANRCRWWYTRTTRGVEITAAGVETDLQVCQQLLAWLSHETERLLTRAVRPRMDKGEGRSWAQSFREGAASEISRRLQEAAKREHQEAKALAGDAAAQATVYQLALKEGDTETLSRLDSAIARPEGRYPLAVVNRAIQRLDRRSERVEEYVEQHYNIRTGRGRRGSSSASGYEQGRRAGRTARLNG